MLVQARSLSIVSKYYYTPAMPLWHTMSDVWFLFGHKAINTLLAKAFLPIMTIKIFYDDPACTVTVCKYIDIISQIIIALPIIDKSPFLTSAESRIK